MAGIQVLAIDPGPHTGMAFRDTEGVPHTIMYEDRDEVLKAIHTLLPKQVVIERFATAGRISADGLYTVDMVGQVSGLIWLLHEQGKDIECRIMTPSSRRAFQYEAKQLKIAIGPHELDALMHLLSYEWRFLRGSLAHPPRP